MTFVKRSGETSKKASETVRQPAGQAPLAIPSKVFQESAGQKEIAVKLRRLPPGINFDDRMGEPIYYDAVRQLLIYRGFMCQASYNYLHRLALDPEYETALDQLYLGTSLGAAGRSWRWLILGGIGLALGAAASAIWIWLH